MLSRRRVLHAFSVGVTCLAISAVRADEAFVAATFSKVATYAFNGDFIHQSVTEAFSAEELAVLAKHRTALNSMIRQALGSSHSVGGALLTAHFGIEENMDLLRWRLVQPGRTYGWEGPDYSNQESYLTDAQYVYHSVYLTAIEETTGAPIHEAIIPTKRETETLFALLEHPNDESYYWAKWLARKLQLVPGPR